MLLCKMPNYCQHQHCCEHIQFFLSQFTSPLCFKNKISQEFRQSIACWKKCSIFKPDPLYPKGVTNIKRYAIPKPNQYTSLCKDHPPTPTSDLYPVPIPSIIHLVINEVADNRSNSDSARIAKDSRVRRSEDTGSRNLTLSIAEALALDLGDIGSVSERRNAHLAKLARRKSSITKTDLDLAENDLDGVGVDISVIQRRRLDEDIDDWCAAGGESAAWSWGGGGESEDAGESGDDA